MPLLKPDGRHPGAQMQQAFKYRLRPKAVCHDGATARGSSRPA